jgi:hypothetical protein
MRVPRSSSAPNHSCLLDTDSCLLELTECPPIDRHPTEAGRIRFRNWYYMAGQHSATPGISTDR